MKTIQRSTPFDKLYFCFFILLPFIYCDKLVDPVLIPRQVLLSIFLFITGALISYKIHKKELSPDFSFLRLRVFAALALFLIVTLFSSSRALAISESMYVLSKFALEALFYILTTYLLIQNQLSFSSVLKAVIIFCILVLIQCIYQVIRLSLQHNDFFDNMLNVTGTFGHKNLLASVLFLTLPFILPSSAMRKWWRITATSCVVLVVLMAWLLQTKAVLIAILLFTAVFLFLLFRNKSTVNRRFIRITIAFVSVGLVGICIFTIANREKFPRIFDKKSSLERLGLWENSKEMIKENPVLGVGAGNWQIHFPKYGMDKFLTPEVKNGITTFQRPHNDFLWVCCEMGIIGLIAYGCIFISIIYYLIRLIRKKDVPDNPWMFPAFLAAVLCYLLIACIDFPLERIEHQVLLLLLFSISTARFYVVFKEKESSAMIINTVYYWLLFLVPVFFSFFITSKRWKGEYHTQRLYFFERNSNWTQLIREAKMAVNSCYTMDPMSAPIEWYHGVALFSNGDVVGAKACFEKAYELHPYNMHVINNLASCYESTGDHKKAEEFYLSALSISSDFEEARLNLSAVYYNTKEIEKAFETIDKCEVGSRDPKYKLFLTAILSSWLEDEARKEKDPVSKQQLAGLKNRPDTLISMYTESKKSRIELKKYILLTNKNSTSN